MEYSVEGWLRWELSERRAKSIVFSLRGVGGAGDVVLELWLNKQGQQVFSSYTILGDRIESVDSECSVFNLADTL